MYYTIVRAEISELEDAVNRMITEGFEPVGGPVIIEHDRYSEPVLIQAMVLKLEQLPDDLDLETLLESRWISQAEYDRMKK